MVMDESLNELPPDALAQLQARMDARLQTGQGERFPKSLFRWPTDPNATLTTSIDWIAFPDRVATCLGRASALRLLDVTDQLIGDGGRRLQEEYAEWRVARSDRGIERVDLTTETSDYWRLLAAHAPERTLELVAGFAGEPEIDPSLVYGSLDPFARDTTPDARDSAFVELMLLDGTSPYNNGGRAITCMARPSNSIGALLNLCWAAATSLSVVDAQGGPARSPTCIELAPTLETAARLGRASDPLIVERLARLAFEGRRIGLDTPAPLAISGVEHTRLRTPSGDPVPGDWFRLTRAMRTGDRYQRLSLSVPEDESFCVGDLVEVTTEETITSGAQIADLVQLSLYLRTTEPIEDHRDELDVVAAPEPTSCRDIVDIAATLEPRSSHG